VASSSHSAPPPGPRSGPYSPRTTRDGEPASCFLARHATGDWGTLDPEDVAENEYCIVHGFRLMSSYQTDASETLWIITEAYRSVTILLLPDEY